MVGSEKIEKCGKTVIFTCDFMAFSTLNEKDEYLTLKGVSFSYIITVFFFFPQLYSFLASGGDKYAYASYFFFFFFFFSKWMN